MPADPSGFDHYRRQEPLSGEKSTVSVSPTTFTYFRRAETVRVMMNGTPSGPNPTPSANQSGPPPIIGLQV